MKRTTSVPVPLRPPEQEPAPPTRLLAEIARLEQRVASLERQLVERETAAARTLAARDARYRSLAESSQDITLITSPSGTLLEVMGNTMGLLGLTIAEVLALSSARILAMLHPEDREAVIEWIGNATKWEANSKTQTRVRDSAGEYRWVELSFSTLYDDSGTQTGHVYLVRDISERVHAQEALVYAERLGALGQMAGGIAHDFNNILVAVLGFAEKALSDLERNPADVRADLRRIIAGANDAAEAVRRLQSLYRRGDDTSDFSPVDLSTLVGDVLALTEPTWKDEPQARGITVHVETHLHAADPVLGNAGELRRVLRNLISNAVEAMPQGGRLTISTRSEGENVVISVSDTGTGMTEEQRTRLFEPFYTTKPSTGSGLGLTVSRSIVVRHGGQIEATSTLCRGSTFTVILPTAPPQSTALAERPAREEYQETPSMASSRANVHALIVDDEDSVRELLQRLVEREGHTATVVSSGREALELLAGQRFDLIITDLGMPDTPGSEVALQAHARWPETPVILSTGWGDTMTPEQLADMHITTLLAKPFTIAKLQEALDNALQTRPAQR